MDHGRNDIIRSHLSDFTSGGMNGWQKACMWFCETVTSRNIIMLWLAICIFLLHFLPWQKKAYGENRSKFAESKSPSNPQRSVLPVFFF